jgi:hypothetical protein
MKKLVNVSGTYSVFGNLSQLLAKIDSVKEIFKDYQVQEAQEQLQNGLPSKSYAFHKDNHAVVIRSYRLDIQFGYLDNSLTEDLVAYVSKVVESLSKIIDFKFNRVSYSDVNFVEKDEEGFKNFADIFNANTVFNCPAAEFQTRINNILNIDGEETNAVILMQDGFVTKRTPNPSEPRQAVIFVNNDINTLAQNHETRFTLDNATKLFQDFVMLGKERVNTIVSKF